ncbi:hypothetical protein ACWD25_39730 [Streptomyces sp. NPDC002920]
MTTQQVYVVAVIGGLSVAGGLLTAIGVALALHAAVARITDLREARRERRDLATCRAIECLGTTTYPTE